MLFDANGQQKIPTQMRAGVVHASSDLLREFAPPAAAPAAASGGEGGESSSNGGGGGGASDPSATSSTALTATTALVPATAAPPAALVPAARAALVAAAERAKAGAEGGATGKKAKAKAGSAALCQALRDALKGAHDPRDLLDAVACPSAAGTARRTYRELMAEDGAPWPTDQSEPPGGLAIFTAGFKGVDSVQNALAQRLKQYAAHAIARNPDRHDIVLFKPSMGEKKGSLCFLMCAATRASPARDPPQNAMADML